MFLTDSGVATALKKNFPRSVFLNTKGTNKENHRTIILEKPYTHLEPKNISNLIHLSKLWNDFIRGLPYHGCFFMCNIRRDMFKRIMPLQIAGSMTAAWSPTSPALEKIQSFMAHIRRITYEDIARQHVNFMLNDVCHAYLICLPLPLKQTYYFVQSKLYCPI